MDSIVNPRLSIDLAQFANAFKQLAAATSFYGGAICFAPYECEDMGTLVQDATQINADLNEQLVETFENFEELIKQINERGSALAEIKGKLRAHVEEKEGRMSAAILDVSTATQTKPKSLELEGVPATGGGSTKP